MIARYTRPEMGKIWSDENKFASWLKVELAATDTLADFGIVPKEAALELREKAKFDVARIREIELDTRHDVIAFTTNVAENVGPASRWLHYGLTSTDVVDTAQALQLASANAILREGILKLILVLKRRALEFKHTPMIGRTHGVHAEPTTYGLRLLLWYAEMHRNLRRFDAAAEDMRVGKLSGAVGSFGHLKPQHEERICASLGLRPAEVSTQVLQRDRHAAYITTLAVIASTLDKIATDCRHLQRTEVREAEEFFSAKQKGSSAMPHKRNPITAENICGLARVIRGNAQVALENVALWHERDISHSSAERVILPDTTIALDYILEKTSNLIDKLLVYPARMMKNLELTGGLVFSGQLLLDLAESGLLREDAYKLVQSHAMAAWQNEGEGPTFKQRIAAEPEITSRLSQEKIALAFTFERQLANVDTIFERVLAEHA
ncbi:adenylosuccinate lyase [Terriglobus tenax]|uniref:adenylosuccinate lyase n=1 Tax=Terriglobus tenax TaxID=1111115 RepID=UPI0021E05DC1|nr:adenylosuccinate lyase [Terriglobus tenax]